MKVLICNSKEEAVKRAAEFTIDQVVKKPHSVLGLATGGTMEPLYAHLVAAYEAKLLSFKRVRTFNLDEYLGLEAEHPCSYHRFMREQLFDHVDISMINTHLPFGFTDSPILEAQRYEQAIVAAGGIDFQLLGIGKNGHIGFNEPTSSLGSRTRIKTLTESTRKSNQIYFKSFEETPQYAITMGIQTILESREILLLAYGEGKAKAIAAAVEGPLSAICPASALQTHPKVTMIIDEAAASQLQLQEYYQHVHPQGEEVLLNKSA